jgi:hypothetical protein
VAEIVRLKKISLSCKQGDREAYQIFQLLSGHRYLVAQDTVMGWTRGSLDAVVGLEIEVCEVGIGNDTINQGTRFGVSVVVLGISGFCGEESRAVSLCYNDCRQLEIWNLCDFRSLSYIHKCFCDLIELLGTDCGVLTHGDPIAIVEDILGKPVAVEYVPVPKKVAHEMTKVGNDLTHELA